MANEITPTTDPNTTEPDDVRQEPVPAASHEGQLAAAPVLTSDSQPAATAESTARAGRQLLTGRAARRLGSTAVATASLSPAQLTWRELKKNRLAMIGLWTLVVNE